MCTNTTGHVVSAWNTRIKFVSSGSDPNGFTWTDVPGVSLPGVPTQVKASAGTGSATVTWAAPANDSGLPITGYVITPFLNGVAEPPKTFNSAALKEVVSGLQKGKSYTFEVAAVNGLGTGSKSAKSNSVSPK